MNWGGGEEYRRFAVVADEPGQLVGVGIGVPQVMGLVKDGQAELGRGIKRHETGAWVAPLSPEQVIGIPE